MAIQKKPLQQSSHSQTSLDYSKIVQSSAFQHLMNEKKRFILPLSLFFLAFYFTLPILTSYSTVLNKPAIGSISWAWIFAFAQFIMTWTLCILYSKRAASFDELVEQIKREVNKGGEVQ
jgi:uncharacterized membrane protein (DUF485 family)